MEVYNILKRKTKNRISFVILLALVFNVLGVVPSPKEVKASSLPKMTSVEVVDKSLKEGTYPTLKLSSKGSASVQYSVYLYSPSKKVWENVSGGYTAAVAGNSTYTIKLKKPLHKGENSFSVWVKKAGAAPTDKGGYDDFSSYRINAEGSSSQKVPSIKTAIIDSSEQKVGVKPGLKVVSNGDGKVQYRVFLYSPSEKVWEDLTNGYTAPVDADATTSLKLSKALHEGENSFSIWVKRSGQDPVNKEGYDNFLSYKINVGSSSDSSDSGDLPTIKSAKIDSSQLKVDVKPTLKLTSTGSEKVEYRVFLYSPSKKVWEDISGGYTSAQTPSTTYELKSSIPLHEGENSFSIWVKRTGKTPANKEGYDNFLSYKVNVDSSSNGEAALPSVKSASIDAEQQKVGINPVLKLTATGSEKVEYRAFLYSPTKKIWEDISGGYTSAQTPSTIYNLKSNTPLHEGENSFSIWVKREGKTPANKEGYDNFLSYKINVTSDNSEVALPSVKSASIDAEQQKIGITPALKLTATGSEKVEYRAFVYSPTKKVWEDISGGYTSAKDPSTTYSLRSSSPLHEGENSFSIWVKRAGKTPANKEGYDNFLSYKINVTEKSNTIPSITSVNIDSSEIELGGKPAITLKSTADTNVQYNVHLYSQSKQAWDDVSNGYSASVEPGKSTAIKITKPLQPGRNTFSIWVKRAGQSPSDPGGYDSFVQEVVNVSIPTEKTSKISSVTHNSNKTAVGTKPEIIANAVAGDGSNISYKAFLYSNSQRKWLDASDYTAPIKGGTATTIALNAPLEAGTNKVLVWAKRAWVTGEVYEDYKIVEIDAIKPAPMKKTIVVDPGHGGKDSGAVSPGGTKERDITLSVSLKLGDILKSNGYEVLYTRTQNDTVNWESTNQSASLKYRTDFANSNGVDMFVSIHCNSGGGIGTETFYSSKNPSKDKALATSIQNELVKAIGLRDRGVKSGNLYVVNNTKMTASLVELAFIDNSSEESKLKDSAFQQKAANGIASGIFKYLGN